MAEPAARMEEIDRLMKDTVGVYAERQALFVIRATGSSASIVNETGFVPRVFP